MGRYSQEKNPLPGVSDWLRGQRVEGEFHPLAWRSKGSSLVSKQRPQEF